MRGRKSQLYAPHTSAWIIPVKKPGRKNKMQVYFIGKSDENELALSRHGEVFLCLDSLLDSLGLC
jgi:hypothetical protein